MAFWIAVGIGVLCALFGIKKDFFPLWGIFFNLMITIYVSIMLTPTVIGFFGELNSHYHYAGCVATIAILIFVILQTITINVLTKTYVVTLPELFDNIGGGILGFLSGFLVTNFIFLIIFTMPFSHQPSMKSFRGQQDSKPAAAKAIVGMCDFAGAISLHVNDEIVGDIVDWLVIEQDPTTTEDPNTPETQE